MGGASIAVKGGPIERFLDGEPNLLSHLSVPRNPTGKGLAAVLFLEKPIFTTRQVINCDVQKIKYRTYLLLGLGFQPRALGRATIKSGKIYN